MAWDQDVMDTVALLALAPGLLAMVLGVALRRHVGGPTVALLGLVLMAYPYAAHRTLACLVASTVLAAGGLAHLWDVLVGRARRPGRAPKRYVLQRAQEPPPPRPPWPPGRG